MVYTIRKAAPDDMKALIALCKAHAHYEQSDYDEQGKETALSAALFGPTPPVHCLVVESDHTLIGYATFMKQYATWQAASYLYLDCLYLQAETRGQGIGAELMAAVKQYAAAEGVSHLEWQTPEFNEGAIRFYKRLGARALSKERFSWSVG